MTANSSKCIRGTNSLLIQAEGSPFPERYTFPKSDWTPHLSAPRRSVWTMATYLEQLTSD